MTLQKSLVGARPRIGGRASDYRVFARLSSLRHRRRFEEIETFLLFIGPPRSGHSLVGSFLDAHPDAVVAHELDVLALLSSGWRRDEMYERIIRHDRAWTSSGRNWFGYNYEVPGQWQGRFRRLQVVGDKRGAVTTERIADDPGLVPRLGELVGVPVRFVLVVRNPFDNLATMARRAGQPPEAVADRYFRICEFVGDLMRQYPVYDLRHEDVVADPRGQMRSLCEWLGLEPSAGYLDACAGVVFEAPRKTRSSVEWSPQLIDRVSSAIGRYDFLSYSMEELP